MRVVHVVCSDGFGGVEQYILTLSRGLAARGVTVDVIGGAAERMQQPLLQAGVGWTQGDSSRMAALALRALPRPDLVVSHMSQADLVAALYRRSPHGWGVPQLSTRHFGSRRGSTPLARIAARVVTTGLAGQLAISEYVADRIEGESVVVHTGVTAVAEAPTRQSVALVAQRLEPEKYTEIALRAWALSEARNRGWRLQVAGNGAQRGLLEAEAQSLGIADSVEFLGFRTDIRERLPQAGLVIAPTPAEGLGILVLEAMSAGTPIVAAAAGGHQETVGRVSPETMFEPGDIAHAAAIIDALTSDQERRQQVGDALRVAQRARFSVEAQVEATLALYERLRR